MIRSAASVVVLAASVCAACGGSVESSSTGGLGAAPADPADPSKPGPGIGRTCGAPPAPATARMLDERFYGFDGVATDGTYVYYTATEWRQVLRQPIGGAPPEAFASEMSGLRAMRGHGTRVCWLADAIYCVEAGGAPRFVARAGGKSGDYGWEDDIDFDDTHVYWAGNSTIERARLDGTGGSEVFADRQADPRSIAVAAGRVFWGNHDDRTVKTCPTSGCSWPVTELGSLGDVLLGRVAADERHVYVPFHKGGPSGRSGALVRIPRDGGPTEPVWACEGESGINVALDGDRAYLLTHAGGFNHAPNGPTKGNVIEITLSSGARRTLASEQESPQDIALANGSVFWTNEHGLAGQLMVASR